MSTFFLLKVGLLVFWGLWYLIAFSTNVCEGFHALGILPKTWSFASSNLRAVAQAISTYSASSPSRRLPRLLLFGVLCAQFLATLLFARAVLSSISDEALDVEAVNVAFAAALGLWAAFMLADEILKQYETEHAHVLFFIAQLVTVIAIHVLPS